MNRQKFNVLSLNLWHGNLEDRILNYISDKKDHFSVFCFQESDPKIFHSLTDLLQENFNVFYAQKPSDHDPFYNATFIRKEFLVTGVQTILGSLKEPGLGLATTIKLDSEPELLIVNTYGCPYPGNKLDTPARITQSEELIRFVKKDFKASIFMGDFNLLPGTKSIDMFKEYGYRDLIEDYNIVTTRNENAWSRYPDNKQLYADYAFIKSDQTVEYDFIVEDNLVSDHLPLLLNLNIDSD